MVALSFLAKCVLWLTYIPVDLIMLNVKGRKVEMMINPFKHKIWLSSPTMHGDELKYVTEAYETNWMSTVGKNINEIEQLVAEKVGVRYAVALSAGTASLHLAMKLAGEFQYGQLEIGKGALCKRMLMRIGQKNMRNNLEQLRVSFNYI